MAILAQIDSCLYDIASRFLGQILRLLLRNAQAHEYACAAMEEDAPVVRMINRHILIDTVDRNGDAYSILIDSGGFAGYAYGYAYDSDDDDHGGMTLYGNNSIAACVVLQTWWRWQRWRCSHDAFGISFY